MTADGVEMTDERAVGMNSTPLGIEEDASAVFFPIQNGSAVVGVSVNELSGGQAPVRCKTCNFVRVDLDFLVATTKKTLRTQEEKRRLSV